YGLARHALGYWPGAWFLYLKRYTERRHHRLHEALCQILCGKDLPPACCRWYRGTPNTSYDRSHLHFPSMQQAADRLNCGSEGLFLPHWSARRAQVLYWSRCRRKTSFCSRAKGQSSCPIHSYDAQCLCPREISPAVLPQAWCLRLLLRLPKEG